MKTGFPSSRHSSSSMDCNSSFSADYHSSFSVEKGGASFGNKLQ
ncbi:hypothetical protein GCWU000342_01871 [Shuttleworthella satelles DSM 14600]|uniref:Uncharacterized protein n=1 Tax=Shuttleworthella satelles DSM 14600 TaxID=626523 RepID=C4GD27_9FIRM|nr:hypothetical protein GCWU000342_01871 [Shuttleworthia satelles DSM 14600]